MILLNSELKGKGLFCVLKEKKNTERKKNIASLS